MAIKRKLTKNAVDALQPGAEPYNVRDSEVPGFFIRVFPNGTKKWKLEYRPGGRGVSTERIDLGNTRAVTPDQARKKAIANLAAVAAGNNPAKERMARRREMTVAQLVDQYAAEGAGHMKLRTRAYAIAALKHHLVPILGSLRISEVTTRDVERMVRAVSNGKTAKDEKIGPRQRIIVRGGESAARKVFRHSSALFAFALRHGMITGNPCANAQVSRVDAQRDRYLTAEEFARLGQALSELEVSGDADWKSAALIRLWALTGARRDEILALKWGDIDFTAARLHLRETKTGRSSRPITDEALKLLAGLPRAVGSPYVFPASRGKGPSQAWRKLWPKLIKAANLTGVTPHVLRHSVGAAAASSGMSLPMIGNILGHRNARSTQIYAHLAPDPVRDAAAAALAPVAAAMAGKTGAPVVLAETTATKAKLSGKVVPLQMTQAMRDQIDNGNVGTILDAVSKGYTRRAFTIPANLNRLGLRREIDRAIAGYRSFVEISRKEPWQARADHADQVLGTPLGQHPAAELFGNDPESPLQWLIGERLAAIFERYFGQTATAGGTAHTVGKDGLDRSYRVGGPFIAFAMAVCEEAKIPVSASSISSFLTRQKKRPQTTR